MVIVMVKKNKLLELRDRCKTGSEVDIKQLFRELADMRGGDKNVAIIDLLVNHVIDAEDKVSKQEIMDVVSEGF